MNIAGKEVPKPALAIGGGAALFFVYRWYKNRAGSATTSTGTTGGVTGSPGPQGSTGPQGPAGPVSGSNWLQNQINDLYRNVRILNKTKADKPPPRKGKSKPSGMQQQGKPPGATVQTKGPTPQPGPGKRPTKTAIVPTRGAA